MRRVRGPSAATAAAAATAIAAALFASAASATLVSLGSCGGQSIPHGSAGGGLTPLPVGCVIATSVAQLPNPVAPDPNDGILLAWNEVQNIVLPNDLRVDRVFDPNASFVSATPGGGYIIAAGTIVSSHYIQWDPLNTGAPGTPGAIGNIRTTISLDSQIFAFITDDQKLFDSDDLLGLPGLDYNDYAFRSLEGPDVPNIGNSWDRTEFNGESVDIDWWAYTPGDWTRLITAYSPAGGPIIPVPVPEPATLGLIGLGLLAGGALRRRATTKPG